MDAAPIAGGKDNADYLCSSSMHNGENGPGARSLPETVVSHELDVRPLAGRRDKAHGQTGAESHAAEDGLGESHLGIGKLHVAGHHREKEKRDHIVLRFDRRNSVLLVPEFSSIDDETANIHASFEHEFGLVELVDDGAEQDVVALDHSLTERITGILLSG